jgi:hypothetical protein
LSFDIFNNSTFASLGLNPGIYTWTWGTGVHADSFTINIGGLISVPEPSSLVLLATGAVGLLGYGAWRRARPRA